MVKNFSKTIFTIVFVVFLGLSFIDEVSANFTCKVGNYTLEYNTSGELQNVTNSSGNKVNKYYESYFHPKSSSDCPDKTGYTVEVSIIDGGRTFYVSSEYIACSLNGYTILYNKDGSISSARKGGSKVDKYFESYFKPTSPSSCPSESEAKVYFIDGNRTFYVGKIDETFDGSNSTPETPSEPEEPKKPGEYAENIGTLDSGTATVSCGTITDIPASIPNTVHIIYMIIQIFVPLALIIFGMIDMARAVMGQKEDEIKKGQQTLIKRIIAAAVVFFVFSVVKLVISFVSDSSDVTACLNCFIDNNCTASVPEEEPEE